MVGRNKIFLEQDLLQPGAVRACQVGVNGPEQLGVLRPDCPDQPDRSRQSPRRAQLAWIQGVRKPGERRGHDRSGGLALRHRAHSLANRVVAADSGEHWGDRQHADRGKQLGGIEGIRLDRHDLASQVSNVMRSRFFTTGYYLRRGFEIGD